MNVLTVQTTQRSQFVDLTADVQAAVQETGIRDGLVTVFVPRTTAGVTIDESWLYAAQNPMQLRSCRQTHTRLSMTAGRAP